MRATPKWPAPASETFKRWSMTSTMRKRVIALLTVTLMLSLALVTRTTGQSASPTVAWVNQINCTANSGSLEKTGGRDDTADAAARSQQTIAAGDAYYEFTPAQTNRLLFTGLT